VATKYDRIADRLRERIASGEWAPGTRMPSETELMADYPVSLNTLRRALDTLDGEALIEKRHGIGTFVRIPRARITRTTDRYQWEKDRVHLPESERSLSGSTEQDTGLDTVDLAITATYEEVPADPKMAGLFGVAEGTTLLRRVHRTRQHGDHALFGIGMSYVVKDMVKSNPDLLDPSKEPWPGGTQHQLYTVGIEVDQIVDEVTARPPTSEEATALDIGSGVAVIEIQKISIDTLGRVVEVSYAAWPGDRTQLRYVTQLKKWQS
jgi:GntR family transcriptional regulator